MSAEALEQAALAEVSVGLVSGCDSVKGGELVAGKARQFYYLLFLIPFIGTLIPSFYSKVTPTLLGLPYFYWYLILWIIITGVIGGIVYFLSESRR